MQGLNVSEHGASTALLDLLSKMDIQRESGNFTEHIAVEPHTEIGQIALEYNHVLDSINVERQGRQQADEALNEEARMVQMLQEVAVAANEAMTVDEALQAGLDIVCRCTKSPIGHVYMRSKLDVNLLEPTSIWCIEDSETFRMFREVTEQSLLH